MRVTISTTARFQTAYHWAAYLEDDEQLERILTPLPFHRVSDLGMSRERTCSLIPFGAWKYATRKLGARLPARALEYNQWLWSASFDASVARLLGKCDVFNGWSGSCLFSIRAAERRGLPSVLQTGSAHIVTQAELMRQEAAKYGGGEPITHPRVIARALREYAAADRIVVPSKFVYDTFVAKGVAEAKLVIVPWAVTSVADPPERRQSVGNGPVRVLFLGACSLRKGVPYLLNAARRAGSEVEIRMVGAENPRLVSRLGGLPENVTAVGIKHGAALQEEFRSADIFVLPSVEDGSAFVTIEAMLAGLPVVVSDQAGAMLIDEGVSGYEVPACDCDALAERLLLLARDHDLRRRVGMAARLAALPRTPTVYGQDLMRLVYAPLLAQSNRAAIPHGAVIVAGD